jgi:hypothetical protein
MCKTGSVKAEKNRTATNLRSKTVLTTQYPYRNAEKGVLRWGNESLLLADPELFLLNIAEHIILN